MALKKQLPNQQHLYAKIDRIDYQKNTCRYLTVFMEVRSDENQSVIQRDQLQFWPLMTPEHQAFFELSTLDQSEQNVIKACYLWLKANKPLFSDWEDT